MEDDSNIADVSLNSADEELLSIENEVEDVTVNSRCSGITPKNPVDSNKEQKKRSREEHSDEGWTIHSRKRKSVRNEDDDDGKLQVSVTCDNALPKQFALARLFKDNKIKNICRVKYVHQHKIMLTFEDGDSADTFIKCQAFAELGWRCQKTSEVGLSFGVIKNVDLELDFPDADILRKISSKIEILSAKRLKKRNPDRASKDAWIPSESVRLGFKGSTLPTHVYILGMVVKVEPYVFPVTQCSRCWKFGHNLKFCPSKKVVCPKCTKNHENCETTNFRCINCTGNHMALQKICPMYKKERRVRELMSEFNCTYRQALNAYVPPSPVFERSRSPISMSEYPPLNSQHNQSTAFTFTAQPLQKNFADLFKSQVDQSSKTPVSHRQKKIA